MKFVNKALTTLIVIALGTTLVPLSACAGNLAFDAAGNLFVGAGHSVFKYTPDGTKSTFATGLKYPLGLCFDGKGNPFVLDGAANTARSQRSILKFAFYVADPLSFNHEFTLMIKQLDPWCVTVGSAQVCDEKRAT